MAGSLCRLAVERPVFALPSELNQQIMRGSMDNLFKFLNGERFAGGLDAKIVYIEKMIADFKAGKIEQAKRHKENWYALNFVLYLLKVEKIKLPRRA
ncbi:MAG: hypothetical protein ACOWW1_05430 [archaeon]